MDDPHKGCVIMVLCILLFFPANTEDLLKDANDNRS